MNCTFILPIIISLMASFSMSQLEMLAQSEISVQDTTPNVCKQIIEDLTSLRITPKQHVLSCSEKL
ncbi:MAG: hypothetical protein FJ219_02905 [Ignavibacteria bacterium]|nr:hypothetical protein [Ignavibacteria bacterium]